MRASDDPGRLARDGYTYLHLPIIAGIIATAVRDDLLVAEHHHALSGVGLAMVLGGPALYLLGLSVFHRRMTGTANSERLAAAALLVLLAPVAGQVTALTLGAIIAVLLRALAIWELRIPRPGRDHHAAVTDGRAAWSVAVDRPE